MELPTCFRVCVFSSSSNHLIHAFFGSRITGEFVSSKMIAFGLRQHSVPRSFFASVCQCRPLQTHQQDNSYGGSAIWRSIKSSFIPLIVCDVLRNTIVVCDAKNKCCDVQQKHNCLRDAAKTQLLRCCCENTIVEMCLRNTIVCMCCEHNCCDVLRTQLLYVMRKTNAVMCSKTQLFAMCCEHKCCMCCEHNCCMCRETQLFVCAANTIVCICCKTQLLYVPGNTIVVCAANTIVVCAAKHDCCRCCEQNVCDVAANTIVVLCLPFFLNPSLAWTETQKIIMTNNC